MTPTKSKATLNLSKSPNTVVLAILDQVLACQHLGRSERRVVTPSSRGAGSHPLGNTEIDSRT